MANYTSVYSGTEIDTYLTAAKNLVNFTGTPVSVTINLVANVPYVLKPTDGWIVAFGAGETPLTEIRNNTTMVWQVYYFQSPPFYIDTSIVLFSPINNEVSIVYT